MQFTIAFSLIMAAAPLAIALPAPSENQFADSVFVAAPATDSTSASYVPAVTTRQLGNDGHDQFPQNICKTNQVAACCRASQGENGILGGLLGNLLGGNCNLLDINLLGNQDNTVVCGQDTVACCAADGDNNDIDRTAYCNPYTGEGLGEGAGDF